MKNNDLTYKKSHQNITVVNHYKKIYEKFDESFKITDRFSYARWLIEQCELKGYLEEKKDEFKEKSCLDFACGTGRITELVAPYFKYTTGVDISNDMIQVAKDNNINANFHLIDITKDTSSFHNKFDVVIAFRFFLRAENGLREEIMFAIKNIIKEDGIFIFNVHDSKKSLNWPLFLYSKIMKRESPVDSNYDLGERRHFETNEVEKMLHNSGFKIEKIAKIGLIPNYLYGLPFLYKFFYKIDKLIYKYHLLQFLSIEKIYYCRAIQKS